VKRSHRAGGACPVGGRDKQFRHDGAHEYPPIPDEVRGGQTPYGAAADRTAAAVGAQLDEQQRQLADPASEDGGSK
jgi:hypothetical protein